jgi:hypothetical protein
MEWQRGSSGYLWIAARLRMHLASCALTPQHLQLASILPEKPATLKPCSWKLIGGVERESNRRLDPCRSKVSMVLEWVVNAA